MYVIVQFNIIFRLNKFHHSLYCAVCYAPSLIQYTYSTQSNVITARRFLLLNVML